MTLQELLGEELFKQVQAKLDEVNSKEADKLKHVRYVDLSEGGYVSKEKYDSKVTELSGVKKQVEDANKEIQSYKDMDIDGIKKSAEDWKAKYESDTKALNDKMKEQEYSHAADMFMSQYKFSSKPAKAGVRAEFDKKQFKLEDGKFLGGEEYMKTLMESEDYKNAFLAEKEDSGKNEHQEENKPFFAQGTGGGATGGDLKGKDTIFNPFGFNLLRQPEKK